MQLTAVFLLGTCLQVAASGFSQSVTFSGKDISLEKVFTAVKRQTGYLVSFKSWQLKDAKPVTIDVENAPLNDFLALALDGQSLEYTIKGKTIFIRANAPVPELSPRVKLDAPPVTGVVRGPDGQPLAGVNIVVKGTKRGTTTNADGSFSIEAKEGEVLIVSSIGYAYKQITIGSNSAIEDIALALADNKLDEVQIIAYGQTSRRLNTGNVVSVKAEEIAKQPINNPLFALQGRVTGLTVTPTTGLAGGAVRLNIRGRNSLNFQADPLVVVDGIPIAKNNITGLGHSQLREFSSLSFINSKDIESIDVLKDADATSIYGSRGANGVILITTKKGRQGATKININAQSGIAEVANKMEMMNTQQYLELRKEAFANSGIDINTLSAAFNNADLKLWGQNAYTDWQEALIGGTAKYNDFQASVSGGNQTFHYLIGGNFHKETTVFRDGNSDMRGGAHISLSGVSVNQKFKTTVTASYFKDRNKLPGVDFTFNSLRIAPNAPALFLADGTLNHAPLSSGSSSWNNPYFELNKTYSATVSNLTASSTISYDITPSLIIKIQTGYNELNGSSFRKTLPFKDRPKDIMNLPGSAAFNTSSLKNLTIDPQVSYTVKIAEGNLNILAGAAYQSTLNADQQIDATGATSDALLQDLMSATSYILQNNSSEYKYLAAFGRLNYNWLGKYILNLSARRDGSSRFGPGNRFGNFGSVGAAWIFSEEQFIKSSIPFLSFGKLRFSYGTSGNDGIGDYQYFERYEPIEVNDFYQSVRGYRTTGLYNSYYAWEVTKKLEAGIEVGFLKDRVLLTGSFFRNRSNNQLINYSYASIAGPGQPLFNMPALIQNMGTEIMLNTKNVEQKDFSWSTSFNFSRNRNKLISYPNIENSQFYQALVGRAFFGEETAFKSAGVDPATGKYQFVKSNGEIVFDPSDLAQLDGGHYLRIMTSPKFFGGLINTFSYKNISLDIFIQFTKQNGVNPVVDFFAAAGSSVTNVPVEFLDRWRKAGDVASIQKIYRTTPSDYSTARNRTRTSDFGYTDASFLRLKNLSLSYSIPEAIASKLKISSSKIYVQGQNLYTLTKYKGLDPETLSTGALPPLRVVTVGLQVEL